MKLCFAFAYCLFAAASALAEDGFSVDPAKSHPPTSQANRIIRWCAENGTGERFASANIELKGYHPCGELSMPIACDAGGKRMISRAESMPAAYKDCALGKRIVVERLGEVSVENYQDQTAPDQGSGKEPLSSKERFDLTQDVKQAEKAQNGAIDIQLQTLLDGMMKGFLAPGNALVPSKLPQRSHANRRFNDQQVDEMIRYVDPQYQKQLEQILKSQ